MSASDYHQGIFEGLMRALSSLRLCGTGAFEDVIKRQLFKLEIEIATEDGELPRNLESASFSQLTDVHARAYDRELQWNEEQAALDFEEHPALAKLGAVTTTEPQTRLPRKPARVEIKGMRSHSGQAREVVMFGTPLLEVFDERAEPPRTILYRPDSLFSLEWLSAEQYAALSAEIARERRERQISSLASSFNRAIYKAGAQGLSREELLIAFWTEISGIDQATIELALGRAAEEYQWRDGRVYRDGCAPSERPSDPGD